jgi:hypothetical protein
MKYDKPKVIALDLAISAIQGGKGISSKPDNPQFETTAAYEADE